LAPAIAPILGGWLHDHLGWRSVFWFLAGLGLLLIGLVLLLEETLNKKHRRSLHPAAVLGAYLRTLIHSHFLRLILSLSFAFAGLFLYIAGAPTVIYDFLGLGAGDFGLQFVPMVGGMIAGAWLTGRLAHRWPIRRTVTFGLFLASTAALLNLSLASLVETTAVSVIAPLTLYSLGFAIAMPAITIQALDYFPQHRGTATSIQGFLQMLISAGVASLAVPLLQGHWWQFALGQFAFVLLALGFWLREAKNFTSITQDLL
jgi:DHA1 family bicyclomycin/chloramphenicol resistance-like MFS transporter